jgi:hypothetical protein
MPQQITSSQSRTFLTQKKVLDPGLLGEEIMENLESAPLSFSKHFRHCEAGSNLLFKLDSFITL